MGDCGILVSLNGNFIDVIIYLMEYAMFYSVFNLIHEILS